MVRNFGFLSPSIVILFMQFIKRRGQEVRVTKNSRQTLSIVGSGFADRRAKNVPGVPALDPGCERRPLHDALQVRRLQPER